MTDVNQRLADILAEYSDTMNRIEGSAPRAETPRTPSGPILKPADQQRAWRPPTFGQA
ncbi:MAG: hypothetical protein ACM4D3_20570 [Candidatus Sericytochromatia bacterium]